jgi:pimeloyl-ACP methyl ester carboxylesterase
MGSVISLEYVRNHPERIEKLALIGPAGFPLKAPPLAKLVYFKGSKEAILSTLRSMPLQSYQDGFKSVGRLEKPVMLIWGREDRTFPFENHTQVLAAMPTAEFVPVENAAHLPQYERPHEVNEPLLEFLSR